MTEPIRWESEFTLTQVKHYKLVKLALMRRAHIIRQWIADRVDGQLGVGGRDYVATEHGLYRIAMNYNSDSTVEQAAHHRQNATTIHVDNPEEMIAFFIVHGLDGEADYEALRSSRIV